MPLDFPSQIVKLPQVLSHLLCSGRYSAFSHFASFSCCVSRCVSPLCLPGAAIATAHRPDRSEQWSCGGEQFQAPPRWDTTGAIDFPAQIVKSPQILSHLLLMVAIFPFPCAIRFPKSNRQISTSPFSSAFSGRYLSLAAPTRLSISQLKSPQVLSHLLLVVAIFPFPRAIRFPSHLLLVVAFSFFSFYIIFLLCLPLCLSVVSPPGGVCNCSPSRPFWAVKLWGRAVPSASSVRHNGCHTLRIDVGI